MQHHSYIVSFVVESHLFLELTAMVGELSLLVVRTLDYPVMESLGHSILFLTLKENRRHSSIP